MAGLVPASVLPLRGRAELTGRWSLPNEGRMNGSSRLSVFDYRVNGVGITAICLRPDPVPDNPAVLAFPDDTPPYYVVTTIVGVPQPTVR